MRSRISAAVLLGLLAFAPVAACDGDGGGGGGGTVPATQLYETWSATFCDIISSCDLEDDDFAFFALLAKANKAACGTFLAHSFDSRRPELHIETAISLGRIVYHADQVAACMSAARSQCALDLAEVSACASVLEGTVATGGSCWLEEECAGDAYCDQNDSDCAGTCQPRPARGAACDYSECSQSEGATACGGDDTCVPRAVVDGVVAGQPCGTDYGTTEVTARHCASGLYCDYSDDPATCKAFAAVGQPCGEAGGRCESGLVCVPSGSGPVCATVSIASTAGAACNEIDRTQPLIGCNIFARLACEAGTCQALGSGAVGTACAAGVDLEGICDYGAYCDGATSTCTPVKADGAECEDAGECASGLCISEDDSPGTCRPVACQ
ncbi:MAG: hypothetical protein EP329_18290 [Deltaproteobacteria bacterium]|nr:MAG: hypothetical protein EP329_18290 [Deltaproteobacteria bacterium]